MVEDLLDRSLVEAEHLKMTLDLEDFKSLADEVLRMLDAPIVARGLQVKVDVDPALTSWPWLTDAKRLRQGLLNLLSNAVKYNVSGGDITVTARRAEGANGGLEVAVADTGIGLVISRRLVQAMGGQPTATRALHVGTTFSFNLPAAPVT